MKRLDKIFDAAGRVLEATVRDQENAEVAIYNLNEAVTNLEKRNQELKRQIQREVKASLEASVSSAADDLKNKLQIVSDDFIKKTHLPIDDFIKKLQNTTTLAEQASRHYERTIHDTNQAVSDRVVKVLLIIFFSVVVGIIIGIFVARHLLWPGFY